VFKKQLNSLISLILIICILAGYAGIPLSTMICKKDGHTSISVLKKAEGCKHNGKRAIKSCCDDANTDGKETSGCCNFNHHFLKIYTLTLTQQIKDKTGHMLASILFFNPTYAESDFESSLSNTIIHTQPPQEWQIRKNKPAFIRIFLI
jgi:hypothetical protein